MPPSIVFRPSGTFFRLSVTFFVSLVPFSTLWYLFRLSVPSYVSMVPLLSLWYLFSSLPCDTRRTNHPSNQKKGPLHTLSPHLTHTPPRNPLYLSPLNPFSPAWCHLDAKQLKCFSKCISQRLFLNLKGVFTSRTVCFPSQRLFLHLKGCFSSQSVFLHLKV